MSITLKAVALDGGRVQVQSPVGMGGSFSSILDVRLTNQGNHVQEFTAGSAGWGAEVAYDRGIERLDQMDFISGGWLHIGRTEVYEPVLKWVEVFSMAVWEGRRWSLFTHRYGESSTQELLSLFEQFDVIEEERGVALWPRNSASAVLDKGASVVFELDDLGLIEIVELNRQTAAQLPRWKGTPTAGGELFLRRATEQPSFVLVTPSAVAFIQAPELRHRQVHLAAELTIQWRRT
jgi:hypothetical protein